MSLGKPRTAAGRHVHPCCASASPWYRSWSGPPPRQPWPLAGSGQTAMPGPIAPRGGVPPMVAALAPLTAPRSEARPNQLDHGATRPRDSAVPNASREYRRAAPRRRRGPLACVQRVAALLVLLTLAAAALAAILQVSTTADSIAKVASPGGAPVATPAETLVVGTTLQSGPDAVPTARIRYDIPGWDSIRRTTPSTDVSAIEPRGPVTPGRIPTEALLVPVVLALLAPALAWVGLTVMLRCIGRSQDVSAAGTDGTPGALLTGLREMALKRPPPG